MPLEYVTGMKYAVLNIKGKQYKVTEGSRLLVDRFDKDPDIKTLLLNNEGKVSIGKPYLNTVKITFKKEEDVKGKKIDVFKYKAKSRYRKHIGFRPQYTPVIIESIS